MRVFTKSANKNLILNFIELVFRNYPNFSKSDFKKNHGT